jgi:hypothetical protein
MSFRLVKIDAHAGRSGVWAGRIFRLGVHDAGNMSQEDQDKLVPMFERFYGAVSERAARAEHPELFAEGGPYFGDHPVLGTSDVRRQGVKPTEGAPADGGGDAAPAPGPEREPAAAGGGHERPEADGRQPEAGDERFLSLVSDDVAEDGSIEVQAPAPEVVPVAQDVDLSQTDIDLAEAVGRLDPDDDASWTPQGIPNLEALKDAVGRRVTRKEVDGVARGFNRTGARAARE